MRIVPKRMFFTKGVGKAKAKLASFEAALRHAGIEKFNLVRVSSIFPPKCKIIPAHVGLATMMPGEVVHAVIADVSTNEPGRLIAASIGLAVPRDRKHYGYLSEHHAFGEKGQVAGDFAEDLAATMLAETLGIPFDPDKAWNEKEEVFKTSKLIISTRNVTHSARADKSGLWTTVVAAAILLPD